MARLVYVVFVCLLASVAALPPREKETENSDAIKQGFNLVSRSAWGARPPRDITNLDRPVEFVIVHHSYIPPDCFTLDACMRSMRSMQDAHQLTNGWVDIGYNFAVGGEGSVFEGRGWTAVGAHATSWNSRSIGICMIGDFVGKLPTAVQLQSLNQLIALGVAQGHISRSYKLIGHRQVSATECPGQTLFNEISTWPHFTARP